MVQDNNRRISFFMPSLAGGGAERVVLTLADYISKQGYEVDVVVSYARGALLNQVPPLVRLVELRAPSISTSVPALQKYFRKKRPKVMLSVLAPTNCVAVVARKLARVKTRLVLSERTTASVAAREANTLRERILPILMRQLYPHADGVIAISSGVADDLSVTIGVSREKIDVIYNPALTSRVIDLSYAPLDHRWFSRNAPPVVLGVGRLVKAKDFSTLIHAFAELRRYRPARLIILGEGDQRPALEALVRKLDIGEDVALPGFVDNPYSYIRNAAVFVLSSRWEGFANVLVEAMACGTPVVSTDCPNGPAEILEHGAWGRLVPVGASHDLALAIALSLEKGGIRAEARAREFSVDNIGSHYLQTLIVDGEERAY